MFQNHYDNDGLENSGFFDRLNSHYNRAIIDDKKKSILRKLFPLDKTKTQYSYLNILENIADIFSYITISRSTKVMNQTTFREFIK